MNEPGDTSGYKWLAASQQLFDSALPTGAYAHSHGLEGLVQNGKVRDADDLMAFLRGEIYSSLVNCDFPVFREAHRSLCDGDLQRISELDELANALLPTHELRKAGQQIGRQAWRLYGRILPEHSRELQLHGQCSEFLIENQVSVIFGLLSAILGIPARPAMTAFAQQVVANFVQASVKLLSFGPSLVQEVLYSIGSEIPGLVERGYSVSLAGTGSMAPSWDIASSQHQFSERRLYIS